MLGIALAPPQSVAKALRTSIYLARRQYMWKNTNS